MRVITCSWSTSLYAIETLKIFPSLTEQAALGGIEELEECDIGDTQDEEKEEACDVEDVEYTKSDENRLVEGDPLETVLSMMLEV